MGNKILNMVGLVITLFGASSAFAKTIYFGSAPEIVPVAYGTATILRFEEPVKTISSAEDFIIKPVNEETPDFSTLSVEPRVMSGKVDAVFILQSGDVAKLRLSVVSRQARVKVDAIYDVKSQKALIESRAAATPYIGRLELMTAMIRGDQVTGYEMSVVRRDVSSGSPSTKVVLDRVYSGEEFKGYVYEVQNVSTKGTVDLDIRKLQFGSPNQAVLAFSDLDLLEKVGSGKDKTRLIVVTKAASIYRDAILPIRVTRKPADAKSGDSHE